MVSHPWFELIARVLITFVGHKYLVHLLSGPRMVCDHCKIEEANVLYVA